MTGNLLITFSATLLGVTLSTVVVAAVFILDYLAGARREVTNIMLSASSGSPSAYTRWLSYINKQKEGANEIRALFSKKTKQTAWALGFCASLGVLLPAALLSAEIEEWAVRAVDLLPFAYLAIIASTTVALLVVVVTFVRGIPKVENLEEEKIDRIPEEYYDKVFGLRFGGLVTIQNDTPDWVWKASTDPNHLVIPDQHERRITLTLKNRGSVTLIQTLESQKNIPLKDGTDLGWRLNSQSLGGPYDPRTEHVCDQRGRMHRAGDYFAEKEDLLGIADEWLEWAIDEWRRIDEETEPPTGE